ncbi:MAG TPA: VOC family protein [Burkholderiales bacterium]|nr:VOC family protein [Burkholderiales bacterium]
MGADAGRGPLPQLPLRLHHYAFVVRDQEANRRFFEDVLGLPLVATWCEKTFNPEAQRELAYCHTFFGLADGSALAFFQFADDESYQRYRSLQPAERRFEHIALKVGRETFDEIERRLAAAGIARRVTDHGYCVSLYATSPDGLKVEFTLDADRVEEINAARRADAHAELSRWLAGDHAPNNTLR